MEPSIIKQKGFSWISLPREEIMPMTILEQERAGIFKRLANTLLGTPESATLTNGDIFSIFPKSGRGQYPSVSKPKAIPGFGGQDILGSKAKLNLGGLKAIQQVGNAELEAKINAASKRLFSFVDPKLYDVETEILLEEHLNRTSLKIKSPSLIEKLQDGKLYVVLAVLKTKGFAVEDATELELGAGVKLESMADLAKLKASAEHSRERSKRLVYAGDVPLSFALKAARILYRGDHYTISREPLAKVRSIGKLFPEGLEAFSSIEIG